VIFETSECTGFVIVDVDSPPVRHKSQALLLGATASLLETFVRYLVVGGLAFGEFS